MQPSNRYAIIALAFLFPSCDTLFGPRSGDSITAKHVEWAMVEQPVALYDYELAIHAVERHGRQIRASGLVRGQRKQDPRFSYTVIEERPLLRKTLWDVLVGNDKDLTRHEVPCDEYSEEDARALTNTQGKRPPEPPKSRKVSASELPERTADWRLIADDGERRGSTEPSLYKPDSDGTWRVDFSPEVVQWAAAQRQRTLTFRIEMGSSGAEQTLQRQIFVDALGDG